MEKEKAEKQFENLVSENELLIYKVCRMYGYTEDDRQDLYQEIVIQLWRSFPKFEGRSKFSTWLYRIALNVAITHLRRQKDFIDSYEPGKLPQHIDQDSSQEEEEQLKLLYKTIEQLNQVEKAIIMLYMEEKTYEEMEEILGMSQGNLRVKMKRIKDKIRELTKNN